MKITEFLKPTPKKLIITFLIPLIVNLLLMFVISLTTIHGKTYFLLPFGNFVASCGRVPECPTGFQFIGFGWLLLWLVGSYSLACLLCFRKS